MNKWIKDGQVAVLISPEHSSGWSTSYDETAEAMLFDGELAQLIEVGKKDQATALARRKYPDEYIANMDNIVIRWLPVGTRFRVDQYDGAEFITLIEDLNFIA